jgi:hypothetical protein
MAFQVAPRAIGQRTLPATLAVLGIVGVIAFAIVTADGSTGAVATGSPSPPVAALQPSARGGPALGATRSPGEAQEPSIAVAPGASSPPLVALDPAASPAADAIDCHDLDRDACDGVVWAALHILGAQHQLRAIGAWQSLLCDSTLDCPERLLDGRRPVGSAVASLRSGDTVWINVMGSADARPTGDRSGLVAWVVRWLPKPAATPLTSAGDARGRGG